MEAIEAILSRRSIRHYLDRPVSAESIARVLEAGMSAPTACDLRPWQFSVIDDRTILDAIQKQHPHASMLAEAPVAILVCGEPDTSRYWQQDCSAAAQNILIAAHSMGLGAVWLGLYPREQRVTAIRQILKVPASCTPLALIALGHPGESKPPLSKYDTSKIHHNAW
jgi:nitroreductase